MAFFGAVAAVSAYLDEHHVRVPTCLILAYSEHAQEWALFWVAAAIVGGGILPFYEWRHNETAERARAIEHAGVVPRFTSYSDAAPLNKALYDLYFAKSLSERRANFLIPDLPLYFIVNPTDGCDVFLEFSRKANPLDHKELSNRAAAEYGFDWGGFCDWWIARKAQLYDRAWSEEGIRACSIRKSGNDYIIGVYPTQYKEHLCTEISANVEIPNQVPSMRVFLEGIAWRGESKIDLSDLPQSANLFSMRISANAIVATSDGYLVLQRRSTLVESAPAGVSPSAAGGMKWEDVSPVYKRWVFAKLRRWRIRRSSPHWSRGAKRPADELLSLRWSGRSLMPGILRELREELGRKVARSVRGSKRPFVGGAFNLRYGRDLNFYAFFQTELSHREIAEKRAGASDSWEVAHLLFIPISSVNDDGTLKPPFENVLGDSRHVRGALYCVAQSERFKALRESITRKPLRPSRNQLS